MTLVRRAAKTAFTLVELLVVIGIIALLISILLPALNNARRQAAQTKCAAQMKQMYNAFLFYAGENRNVWPVAQLQLGATYAAPTKVYNVNGADYPVGSNKGIYYYDFAAKYLTKTKQGVASTTADEAVQARRSAIWACPSWEGYATTAIGGINRSQVGIGMNAWPTFTASYPGPGTSFPSSKERAYILEFGDSGQSGTWVSGGKWGRQGASRMLLADSRFWLAESNPMPTTGVFPPQPTINNTDTYTSGVSGQTTIDVYRHGKYPNVHKTIARAFEQKGGKVAYNVLYCDGHVSGAYDQRAAYESIRQRFPG